MNKPADKLGYQIKRCKIINLLQDGREKWREKALMRAKELRKTKWKIRDIARSRDYWRDKARMQGCLASPPGRAADGCQPCGALGLPAGGRQEMSQPVKGYRYPLQQVSISISWYLFSSSGYRCIRQHWALLGAGPGFGVPSFCAVRQWVLRLGYYKLHQPAEQAADWAYIVDYTHQIGQEQSLLILGVRLGALRAGSSWALGTAEVQVLWLSISCRPDGEHLQGCLEQAARRTGAPAQIVADGAANIQKGIRLFNQGLEAPAMYTYDISHQVARLLKALLEKRASWQQLTRALSLTQKKCLHTKAAFLTPPSLRKTARYMNLFEIADWIEGLLAYRRSGGFSQLADEWAFEPASPGAAVPQALLRLKAPTRQAALQAAQAAMPEPGELPGLHLRHNGAERFRHFFGDIVAMPYFLGCLLQLVELVRCLLQDFKEHGLSKGRLRHWQELPDGLLEEPARLFFRAWRLKMQPVVQALPDEEAYLAPSDVIESLFGHYKAACEKHWLRGISANILMIPALAGKLSPDLIRDALLGVRYEQVQDWFAGQRQEGSSFLSMRRKALGLEKRGPKTVGTDSS